LSQPKPEKARPSEAGQVMIEIMNGPEDGLEVLCEKFPFTIGRASENAVSLQCDHLISRRHARIARSDRGFLLSDLKSTNGTFIENKRVKKTTPIESESLFRVGATLLRIKPAPGKAPSE